MALKASGAYRHCTPCADQPAEPQKRNPRNFTGGEPAKICRELYRRTWSSSSGRKELEARLKVISSGDGTPASASGRRVEPVVFVEESEPKEWVALVEPGVLITFLSLPKGGNDLKRVRFSQEMFNKWQAHRWWAENCENVMELYNVHRLNHQSFPLPTTPRSQDDTSSKTGSISENPLLSEQRPHTSDHGPNGTVNRHFSKSLDHDYTHDSRACNINDSNGIATTPKCSSTSRGVKTLISSTTRTSSFRDHVDQSGEILESEWVEHDEPGVYLTIRALPDGRKELSRVRFSREKFKEMHAKLWWEENRTRINKQYL